MGEENDYLARYEAMKETVNRVAWDGEWYARATMDDGRFLGVKREPMAKIWLNAQTWAVLSGMAPAQRAHQAMEDVYKRQTYIYDRGVHDFIDAASAEKSLHLAAHYEQLSKDYGCAFLDAAQVAAPSEWEGLHLDKKGHAALGRAAAEAVRRLMK